MNQSPIPQDAAAGHPVAAGLYEAGMALRSTLPSIPRNALAVGRGVFARGSLRDSPAIGGRTFS